MNGHAFKRHALHAPLVLGCALLWGVMEVLALSRARRTLRRGAQLPTR